MDQDFQAHLNQVSLEDDNFQIVVQVTDPVVKDGVQKYILYTVRGTDRKGAFEVMRRYSDFYAVRNALLTRWPGCFIPPIPPKKAVGNMDAKFIEERREFLSIFCKKLAKLKHLWYSDEMDVFVRSTSSDVEKALNNLPKALPQDIIYKYESTFRELSGKEINQEVQTKILNFQTFLKKVHPMLENFKAAARTMKEQSQQSNEQMVLLLEYLMPEYEKNCLSEYVTDSDGKLVFQYHQQLSSYPQYKQILQQQEYDSLYSLVRVESREIEAFSEAIAQRDKYEQLKQSKINQQKELQTDLQAVQMGKTTIKSIFSKGSKQETETKMQGQIESIQQEINQLQFLCDLITVIIAYVEIDRFKTEKEMEYFETIKRIAHYEIDNAKFAQNFWDELLLNPNFQEVI